jgi:hypothetical protein
MEFDYQKGGEEYGRYYPALKPIKESTMYVSHVTPCSYYQYEPGNGTRYDVVFSEYPTKHGMQQLMTIANMGRSMILSGEVGMYSLSYMREKLGLGEGDCYALLQLINWYMRTKN